ncbi:MAG: 4Fe-4S dicluster domain-containing protein [Bacteroidales bacterium]|nr:4Fe-4S dicluster domain-containing protein [Bacteroidales bacterium]
MNLLRKLRTIVAIIFFLGITLLFLDFTGIVHSYLGWMAKIQFLPALLAVNFIIVGALIALTLVFGRIYCSVICPLGIFQDVISHISVKRKKNKYSYSKAISWLRYSILLLFIIALVAGLNSLVALLAPYSSYGRIVSNLFAPIYQGLNNVLAFISERADNYLFYSKEIWIKSLSTFIISIATFVVILVLAWKNGRSYCNTICPVGTVLGFISKYSFLKIHIDTDKCNYCGLCARNCKASCINPKEHKIDYSRCVDCFDCIDKCKQGAISFGYKKQKNDIHLEKDDKVDNSRRNVMTASALVLATSVLKAQEKKVDGGLAFIEDKKVPKRNNRLVPPGAKSIRHFSQHCTACQLCVSVCPNDVLRPSTNLQNFMQPELSYEKGYCRPECNKCSEVCPAGAIEPLTIEDKSSTQIGHAVWVEKNCVVLKDGVSCGNCADHCPTGSITMVEKEEGNPDSPKIPIINVETCIGCGACENLCPARPFSAIYVEGHLMHKTI